MDSVRIPLVYLKEGRVVKVGPGGQWLAVAKDDGVGVASKLFEEAKHLYVFDLDAQASGVANLALLQTLEKRQVFPWVDAAPRTADDAMDILFAGAEALTIQPRRLEARELEDLVGLAEADVHIAVATGLHGLEAGARPRELADQARRLNAKGVVLYETPTSDLQRASDAAFELTRADLRVAWLGRPGSPHHQKALASQRFHDVLWPEGDA